MEVVRMEEGAGAVAGAGDDGVSRVMLMMVVALVVLR